MSTGWRLLQLEPEQEADSKKRKISTEDIANRAFYPLTLPLTVGPGSIFSRYHAGRKPSRPAG